MQMPSDILLWYIQVIKLVNMFLVIMVLLGERTKRFFKMQPTDVNYDRKYYQNTFISATRAMSDYLLKPRYDTVYGVLCGHPLYSERTTSECHFAKFY